MIAATLGVSERTLRNWRRAATETPRRMGRPAHDACVHRACLYAVRRVMRAERNPGLGGVSAWEALDRRYPLRVVRASVKAWKARDRARARLRVVVHRTSVEMRARDAVWSLDGTQVGRGADGGSRHVELVRELSTLGVSVSAVGGPQHGWEAVALLERVCAERGCRPLVLATDNGPENVNAVLAAYLRLHRIVHLRNLPRTPQHNCWVERAVRELKEAAGCRAGEVADAADLQARLDAAARCLNRRRRPSRGRRTAEEMLAAEPPAEALVDRGCFYAAACSAVEEAVRDREGGRARRMAERSAILQTLVNFELIRWTRGGIPLDAS